MSAPLRVLIVEDSEDDALLLIRELKRGGYEPTFQRVETADEMRAVLDNQGWDLVISDYAMPNFSGTGALELFMKSGLDIPFILVSGAVGEEIAVEAMKGGAHDIVLKKNLSRLLPAIRRELHEVEVRKEKKRTEEALRESEGKLKALFDILPVGISIVDKEHRIVSMNSELGRIVDLSSEDLISGEYKRRKYLHGDGSPMSTEEFPSILAMKEQRVVKDMEIGIVKEDGSTTWTNVSAVYLPGYGAAIVTTGITERKRAEEELKRHRDHLEELVKEQTIELKGTNERLQKEITEKARNEEQIRKLNRDMEKKVIAVTALNKELEEFSRTVSHDLRAPLRAIDSFSRILLEEYEHKLDDEGKRLIGIIRGSMTKMNKLIEDLLRLASVGTKQIEWQRVDMNAMTQKTFGELKASLRGREVQVVVGDMPDTQGSPEMLHQVLLNLMQNAVKFTKKRKDAVIEVGGRVEGSESVYYVRDNGVGFDMQYADKLFAPFQRLHPDEEFEGSGIGLAVVKRAISRHGGRVWAKGRPDEGATFYFTIPIESEEKEAA